MKPELDQFTSAFERAVRIEMDEMKRNLGSFEVPIGAGRAIGAEQQFYQFDLPVRNEKLFPGMECELRFAGGSELVTISELGDRALKLETKGTLPLGAGPFLLVVYPWFLYEKLIGALESLHDNDSYSLESAFRAFGRGETRCALAPSAGDHPELNTSQLEAVELCLGSNLAFIWGPPGTGKTTTLAHVIDELLESGRRVLVTSTTNAAVDQVLEKMAAIGAVSSAIARGDVLRAGSGSGETYGSSIQEIVERLTESGRQRRRELHDRKREIERRIESARELRKRIEDDMSPGQTELFETGASPAVSDSLIGRIFAAEETPSFAAASVASRVEMLSGVEDLLSRELDGIEQSIEAERAARGPLERRIVNEARLTLTTMASMYVNPALLEQRYDTVIIEEAGIAVLPAVFYCSALAREQVLFVGDPRQLPPIVQSRDPYVRRAMGRSIFDVTVPEPEENPIVALLDTQYRMHPAIGDLISGFFYGGHVKNGVTEDERRTIVSSGPCPGDPLILYDTCGAGTCRTREGGYSRYNETTALLCVDLAALAAAIPGTGVAIITPYVEQSRRVQTALSNRKLREVECRTIHRFQGGERDVVIFDLVDTAPLQPGKLLAGDGTSGDAAHLLNVSFSRARGKLIVLADVSYFSQSGASELVSDLIAQIEKRGKRITKW